MDSATRAYAATADAMVVRILETLRAHPTAADLDDVWGLFKVPGFECDDLQPSYAQAAAAFAAAKRMFREEVAGKQT